MDVTDPIFVIPVDRWGQGLRILFSYVLNVRHQIVPELPELGKGLFGVKDRFQTPVHVPEKFIRFEMRATVFGGALRGLVHTKQNVTF
jgi:hypothetical protein